MWASLERTGGVLTGPATQGRVCEDRHWPRSLPVLHSVTEDTSTLLPRPAGFFRRLAAMFYDSLLLLSVLIFATLAVLPLTGGEAIVDNRLYQAYLLVIWFLYFGWHWVRKGHTLGMRAWRIRLIQDSGEPLTWWHALLRFMLAIVSLLMFGLGFLWMLVRRDKATWHDSGSGTRMVVQPAPRPRRQKTPPP